MSFDTRSTIISAVHQHACADLDVNIAPEHRYLAVFILDDDTQPARIIESAATEQEALNMLSAPPEIYAPEYIIDLDAPSTDEAVRPVVETTGGAQVEDYYVPFDEQNISFA